MSVQFVPSIFREYDIRGIADRDYGTEFSKTLGQAFAQLIFETYPGKTRPRVSVGRDCRLTSDKYAEAVIDGLVGSGLEVYVLGVCPTPLTYFSLFNLDLDGGIMITGSHNPANYNGFKVCVGKETIYGEQIQGLRKRIERGGFVGRAGGMATQYAVIPRYLDHLAKNILPLAPRKIVIDAGNGTAGSVAPALFNRLGAEVVPLFCELDGRFPNHHPDPTELKNLTAIIEKVKKTRADLGVAFDGDADRIGLVDSAGRVYFGDELMVLLSREVLKSKPGSTIISEVKSSNRLYEDIAKHGGKPLMWKTGHSLIKSKMKETGAALAGEMSGHIFFADRYFGYDDAIYAAARVYEIASKSNQTISDMLSDLPRAVATPEIRVDCEEEKKFSLVTQVKTMLAAKHQVNDIDGVRIDFGDGWGLIRASNTQPVLVLRFEAQNSDRLNVIRKLMETSLAEAAQAIGHAPIQFN